jgi:hypothetical protein
MSNGTDALVTLKNYDGNRAGAMRACEEVLAR